jgi:ABC-type antimicrobial peptide transport system ATPase subunit
MKKKTTIILLLLSIGLSSMQCIKKYEEPKPTLPAETQTGANTFGCLVNGELWLPKSNFPYSSLNATIQFDILNLVANQGNKSSIVLVIRDLKSIGEYSFSDKIYASFAFGDNEDNATLGKIIVTKYDKKDQIISGRFWFNAENSNGEIIHVTDGRFDLNYTN